MKRIVFFVFLIFILSGCYGNSDKEEPDPLESSAQVPVESPIETAVTTSTSPTSIATQTPVPSPTDLLINPLTGQVIDRDAALRRPVAIVINNLNKALPQSGISQADIMYEVLAEGGVTRMVGIFKDFGAEKIGPVRSTRHYFLDFALDNDAIFAHHGGSPQGYSSISSLKINNLDGMNLEGKTFFRDQARKNTPGMYEHSSYTSAMRLLVEIRDKGYRAYINNDYKPQFQFYDDNEIVQGDPATKIIVPFSPQSQVGEFLYQEEENIYLRSQNGRQHIDDLTGEQLSVSNIIVQYVNMYVIPGDDAGRREVELVGSGNGVLFTQGVSMPIKWAKSSHSSPTQWVDADGEALKLSKGKTWICVFSDKSDIVIE